MSDLARETIEQALTTKCLGRSVLYLARVGSTNDVAHAQATTAAEGLLIVADEQTAGRGRLARGWWSPPGANLLMSLLLRPPLPARRAGQLTMCLGLAAAEGIEAVVGVRAMLKWPNDLVWRGRKLGGMLTELRLNGEQIEYAVLGLGINVNVDFARAAGVPAELRETATSLLMITGHPVARLDLLAAILSRCEAWYDRLLAGESLHEAWAGRLDTLGREVRVSLPTAELRGVATRVTPDGALIIRTAAGREETIWAGDVQMVR
ncbi:MAG: biotin--[acetyl-CoA-carboxylase] ligase [Anaerolineae bacterium]